MASPDDEEVPPAIPEWEPSELAKQISRGHRRLVHFRDISAEDLAVTVQAVMDTGNLKRFAGRLLYWDPESNIAVLVNRKDRDGGTVFPSSLDFFAEWGNPEELPR